MLLLLFRRSTPGLRMAASCSASTVHPCASTWSTSSTNWSTCQRSTWWTVCWKTSQSFRYGTAHEVGGCLVLCLSLACWPAGALTTVLISWSSAGCHVPGHARNTAVHCLCLWGLHQRARRTAPHLSACQRLIPPCPAWLPRPRMYPLYITRWCCSPRACYTGTIMLGSESTESMPKPKCVWRKQTKEGRTYRKYETKDRGVAPKQKIAEECEGLGLERGRCLTHIFTLWLLLIPLLLFSMFVLDFCHLPTIASPGACTCMCVWVCVCVWGRSPIETTTAGETCTSKKRNIRKKGKTYNAKLLCVCMEPCRKIRKWYWRWYSLCTHRLFVLLLCTWSWADVLLLSPDVDYLHVKLPIFACGIFKSVKPSQWRGLWKL